MINKKENALIKSLLKSTNEIFPTPYELRNAIHPRFFVRTFKLGRFIYEIGSRSFVLLILRIKN